MRFLIFGAGALGQALGCLLTADGHRVDLVLRPRYRQAIQENGLEVEGLFGGFAATPDQLGLAESIADCRDHRYDFILITTKSYDTARAVEEIADLDPRALVVSLQNGCGNLEQLIDRFGPDRSLAGRVITGFEIRQPGRVAITVHADAVHIGGVNQRGLRSRIDGKVAAQNLG